MLGYSSFPNAGICSVGQGIATRPSAVRMRPSDATAQPSEVTFQPRCFEGSTTQMLGTPKRRPAWDMLRLPRFPGDSVGAAFAAHPG